MDLPCIQSYCLEVCRCPKQFHCRQLDKPILRLFYMPDFWILSTWPLEDEFQTCLNCWSNMNKWKRCLSTLAFVFSESDYIIAFQVRGKRDPLGSRKIWIQTIVECSRDVLRLRQVEILCEGWLLGISLPKARKKCSISWPGMVFLVFPIRGSAVWSNGDSAPRFDDAVVLNEKAQWSSLMLESLPPSYCGLACGRLGFVEGFVGSKDRQEENDWAVVLWNCDYWKQYTDGGTTKSSCQSIVKSIHSNPFRTSSMKHMP